MTKTFRVGSSFKRELQHCAVCGKILNSEGICNDCGLPSKDAFLKALNQAIKKELK